MSYKTYDLIGSCSKSKKPGSRVRMHRVPLAWIKENGFPVTEEEWKLAQSPAQTPVAGDSVRLHGDIELDDSVEGEGKFAQFDIRIDSGKVLYNMVGEKGTAVLASSIDFQLEGNGPSQMEFAIESLKPCYLYIVELRNGQKVVIGQPGEPAYCESLEGDGGAVAGDFVGATYKISCAEHYKFYSGAIDITPNPAPTP